MSYAGLDNWIEGDPGVGLDDYPDEPEPPCENCGGTGVVRYWPDGVSQYQHPGWPTACPDCGGE